MGWMREQEAAAQARCEAATDGEWDFCLGSGGNLCTAVYAMVNGVHQFICDCWTDYMVANDNKNGVERDHVPDMDFIAHARTDLPAAIENGQRLRDELIKVWAHRPQSIEDAECPCAIEYEGDTPAPLQECTCGLTEALWGQEGELDEPDPGSDDGPDSEESQEGWEGDEAGQRVQGKESHCRACGAEWKESKIIIGTEQHMCSCRPAATVFRHV